MGKRKQTTPMQMREEKRQQLQWNMLNENNGDAGSFNSTGSLLIIPDDDPILHQEEEAAIFSLESNSANNSCTQQSDLKQLNFAKTNFSPDKYCSVFSKEVYDFFQSPQSIMLFKQHLEDCTLCITIHSNIAAEDEEWYFEIGRFSFKLQPHPCLQANTDHLPISTLCWLYISHVQGRHMIYFEDSYGSNNECIQMFWHLELNVDNVLELFEGLETKHFQLVRGRYDSMKREQEVIIYGRESIVMALSYPSEAFRLKPVHKTLKKLMCQFHNIGPLYDLSSRLRTEQHDFHQLYEAVMSIQQSKKMKATIDVQHPDLKPLLRPYQRDAVVWMLHQECFLPIVSLDDSESFCDLHPLYVEMKTSCGKTFYYNRHGGSIVKQRPSKIKTPPGGILADEMGLGKTVEVLCLILLHQRPPLPPPFQLPTLTETQLEDKGPEKETTTENEICGQEEWCDTTLVTAPEAVAQVSESEAAFPDSPVSSGKQAKELNAEGAGSCDTVQMSSSIPHVSEVQRDISSDLINFEKSESNHDTSLSMSSKSTKSINIDAVEIEQIFRQDSTESENCIIPNSGMSPLTATSSHKPQQHCKLIQQTNSLANSRIERKQLFECVCGKSKNETNSTRKKIKKALHVVECVDCGAQQHAECLNYDLADPFRGQYKCPHCHVASTPLPSGATLIISPSQICDQWVEEIMKHIQVKSLNVFVYQGVNRQGFIQPHMLASQDIVVTTYETLCKELDYVDLPHTNSKNGRRFRHPKRFMAIPSPLVAVEWWRVCLDEAQMVECVTAKTAEMALRLTAINRWCVTGTPLIHSVEDIYGLLLFLGVDPYCVMQWWRILLWEPYCHGFQYPLHHSLSKVLWRTAKKDVINQIELPEQTEQVCWLTFSPIEDHFYRRLYNKCFDQAMKNLSGRTDLSTKLNTMDSGTLNKLLQPLLHLRQACCHPQVVRGAFIPIHDSMLTMEELLESLIKKTKYECEEAHRGKVAAMNGLAALQIIQKQPKEAVELYREVLQSVEECKAELGTDELQQLHAMFNLQEVLATKPQGVAPTLRDHQLTTQCKEVQKKYMTKAETYVATSREQFSSCENTIQELQQELDEGTDWWLEVIDWAAEREMGGELVLWVRDNLADHTSPYFGASILSFRDTSTLQYIIDTQLQVLESARNCLLRDIKKLDKKGGLTPDVINQTVECCLRPSNEVLKSCPFCKVESLLTNYESKLFAFKEGSVFGFLDVDNPTHKVNTIRRGTWADGQAELALKSILSFGRTKRMQGQSLHFGAVHIKLLDGLKKEFKQLRVLWMALREHVSAIDELKMATIRLRIRHPDEPRTNRTEVNILEPTEVEAHKQKLMTDRIVNQGELQKKLGQLMYLKNLAKSQHTMSEGKNPEPCPVCQHKLGHKWSVLRCGHCYCMDCIDTLLTRLPQIGFRTKAVKCPMCREMTPETQISYVSMQPRAFIDAVDSGASVKGSHSSKVTAVVQCLLNIRKSEPGAKTLVFSTWTDVLDVIGKALEENSITYTTLHGVGNVQRRNLSLFKEKQELSVLLLPYHSGANGLNLIEATHAILVEPILNPAQEAQAIGRIHRIGQTRQTKIHRFFIRRTIEERIHTLVESTLRPAAVSAEKAPAVIDDSMTIGQLTSLFQDTRREDYGDDEDMNDIEHAGNVTREQAAGSSDVSIIEAISGHWSVV